MDPTFDTEASERMDEDDVGERFCEDFVWNCWTLIRKLAYVFFIISIGKAFKVR